MADYCPTVRWSNGQSTPAMEVRDSSWQVKVPELLLPVHQRLHMDNGFVNDVFSSCGNGLLVLGDYYKREFIDYLLSEDLRNLIDILLRT